MGILAVNWLLNKTIKELKFLKPQNWREKQEGKRFLSGLKINSGPQYLRSDYLGWTGRF